MVWRISRAILALLAAAAAGAGCTAGRDAGPNDLVCTVEPLGADGPGLPTQVRITVRNKAAEAINFTLPRPLIDEQTLCQAEGMLVMLGLVLADKQGHEEVAVYAHPRDESPQKPQTVVLAPQDAWSAAYTLNEFYFWGPCGPDTGGDFTRYFSPGGSELSLRAILIFNKCDSAEGPHEIGRLESKVMTVRCDFEAFEDGLFKKNPPRI
jgi:hypothetical protein